MNGHDAHDVLALAERTRGGEIRAAAAQCVDVAQETEEPALIRAFKFGRTVDEHTQICLPQDAAGQRPYIVVVSRIAIEHPKEFGNAVHERIAAPRSDAFKRVPGACHEFRGQLVSPVCRQHVVNAAPGRMRTQFRKLFHAQPDHGRCEYRGERGILPRIIERREQGEHHTDLAALKVAARLVGIGGDTRIAQGIDENPRPPLRRAQEDHDVAVSQRMPAPAVVHDIFLGDQFCDAPRDKVRLHLEFAELLAAFFLPLLFFLFIRAVGVVDAQQVQLHGRGKGFPARERVEFAPRIQARLLVVRNIDGGLRHDLRKYVIDGFEHFGAAAEILRHRDERSLRRPAAVRAIGLLKEDGIGKAESIDALLDVADDKAVVPARDLPQNPLLQAVRILILIHHDGVKMPLKLDGDVRGIDRRRIGLQLFRVRTQKMQCFMLEIAEIQDAARNLFTLHRRVKFYCELRKPAYVRVCAVLRRAQILRSLGETLQELIPRRKDSLGQTIELRGNLRRICVEVFAWDRAALLFCRRCGGHKFCPCRRILRVCERLDLSRKGFVDAQMLQYGVTGLFRRRTERIVPLRQQREGAPVIRTDLPERRAQLVDEERKSGAFPIRRIVRLAALRGEPRLGRGLTEREFVKGEHRLLQPFVAPLIPDVGVGKGEESLRISLSRRGGIFLLKQLLKDIVRQQKNLLLACQPIVRRNLRRLDIRLQYPLTKGVKGRNIRARQENALTFKSDDLFISVGCRRMICSDAVNLDVERSLDALAHLRCRRFRKGEDKHAIKRKFPAPHPRNDALHEDARLARSCRRRDEDILPARINRLPLIRRKAHVIRHPYLPPLSRRPQSPPSPPAHRPVCRGNRPRAPAQIRRRRGTRRTHTPFSV